jgi:hypothetical protein
MGRVAKAIVVLPFDVRQLLSAASINPVKLHSTVE